MFGFHALMLILPNMFSILCANRSFLKRPERADVALRARASHPRRGWQMERPRRQASVASHALLRVLLLEHTLVSGWSSEILEHPRASFFERLLGATAPGAYMLLCLWFGDLLGCHP